MQRRDRNFLQLQPGESGSAKAKGKGDGGIKNTERRLAGRDLLCLYRVKSAGEKRKNDRGPVSDTDMEGGLERKEKLKERQQDQTWVFKSQKGLKACNPIRKVSMLRRSKVKRYIDRLR